MRTRRTDSSCPLRQGVKHWWHCARLASSLNLHCILRCECWLAGSIDATNGKEPQRIPAVAQAERNGNYEAEAAGMTLRVSCNPYCATACMHVSQSTPSSHSSRSGAVSAVVIRTADPCSKSLCSIRQSYSGLQNMSDVELTLAGHQGCSACPATGSPPSKAASCPET